jgi:hypothetical protein
MHIEKQGALTVDGTTIGESRIEKTNPLGKFTLNESGPEGNRRVVLGAPYKRLFQLRVVMSSATRFRATMI